MRERRARRSPRPVAQRTIETVDIDPLREACIATRGPDLVSLEHEPSPGAWWATPPHRRAPRFVSSRSLELDTVN